MMYRILIGCTALVIVVALVPFTMDQSADARPPYLTEWEAYYPDSTLPQRMETQFGAACFVCHSPSDIFDPGTCYREDLHDLLDDGHSILEAIDIANDMDSDSDGFTNGEQILMPRPDLPGEVGYHPGLSGCFGTDDCGVDPSIGWTGVPETPTIDPIPGDIDCNGEVNVDDLLTVLNNWGTCPDCNHCAADLNNDCFINVDDLLIVLNNWG